MLLNAFDVDPGADERTLELHASELHSWVCGTTYLSSLPARAVMSRFQAR